MLFLKVSEHKIYKSDLHTILKNLHKVFLQCEEYSVTVQQLLCL